MNKVFVDDQDVLMEALRMGTKWDDTVSKMIYSEDKLAWDTENKEEDDVRTMREVKLLAMPELREEARS